MFYGRKTIQDIYDSMSEEQKQLLYRNVGYALDTGINCFDVYESMTSEQQVACKYIINELIKRKKGSEFIE